MPEFFPIVVGPLGGLDGEVGLALVQQRFYKDVAIAPFGTIEYQLDVAAHGEDAIVTPICAI